MKRLLMVGVILTVASSAYSLELPKAETKAEKCAKVLGVINEAANMRLLYEIKETYYGDNLSKEEVTRYRDLQWSYWNIEKHFESFYIALECAKDGG